MSEKKRFCLNLFKFYNCFDDNLNVLNPIHHFSILILLYHSDTVFSTLGTEDFLYKYKGLHWERNESKSCKVPVKVRLDR